MPGQGRKSKYTEFFKTWHGQTGLSVSAFATRCGKKTSNMSNYLNNRGAKPGKLTTQRALNHFFAWPVSILMEMHPVASRRSELPTTGGLYVLFDGAGNVVYIGRAKSFRAEVWQTLGRAAKYKMRLNQKMKRQKETIRHISRFMSLYQIDSPAARDNFEALLLRVIPNQTHNTNTGHFKK